MYSRFDCPFPVSLPEARAFKGAERETHSNRGRWAVVQDAFGLLAAMGLMIGVVGTVIAFVALVSTLVTSA